MAIMDETEKWIEDTFDSGTLDLLEIGRLKMAWQESARQKEFDATVERLKGFQKGLSKGIAGERARIAGVVKKEIAKYNEDLEMEEIYALERFLVILDRTDQAAALPDLPL